MVRPLERKNPMGRGPVVKAAGAERQAGSPAQEVFDKYKGQVWPENALAMAIASVADPEVKRHYTTLNYVLVGLLILAAFTTAVTVLFMLRQLSIFIGLGGVILGVLVPVIFAVAVWRFDGRAYGLLMLICGANALNVLTHIPEYGIWVLSDLVMLAMIFILAFIQKKNVFPNLGVFRVKKDDQGNYVWGERGRYF